jgi:BMFP domain-containing protein YqiC
VRLAAAAVLLTALAGCGEKGDPVRQTLDRMADGARDRDVAQVAAHLAADYRDAAGNGRSDVEQTLRGYFAAYESLDVTLREVSIERAEGAARARFRADFSGRARREAAGIAGLLPSSASYRFDVRLTPEGSGWKVAWASWEPVER